MSIAWLVRTRPNVAAAVAHKQTNCSAPRDIDNRDLAYIIEFIANNLNAGMQRPTTVTLRGCGSRNSRAHEETYRRTCLYGQTRGAWITTCVEVPQAEGYNGHQFHLSRKTVGTP